jgi:hypothetical protein
MWAVIPPNVARVRCISTVGQVKSCSVLAVQAQGAQVVTIEGIGSTDDLHPNASGVSRLSRLAVRVLHAGHDYAGH